jgi:dihydroorotase
MTLLIKNGKVYQNGNLIKKNIFIKKDKIIKITGQELKADDIIDAKNKIIIPGLIDEHVHFREPGLTHKEDFFTGSMAAAAGGITTILDMPNTLPPTTNLQRLDEKRRLAKKSIVNYGFHFGSTDDNIAEIKKVKNVAAIKVYMHCYAGDLRIDNQHVLKNIFSSNKTIAVHAENESVLEAVSLMQHSNNHLHFCHISSKEELHYATKEKKHNVSVEVTPHHLFLTAKDLNKLGSFGEMKPSLKTIEDQKALWNGIHNNKVDTIATDHAPHTKEEKLDPNYPYGVPGCETMLPLLLNAVNEKKLTLKKLVQLCCENPAKIFKIKNKGRIKEGFDADLTIIDLDLEKEVKNQNLFTKCRWSPFDGWKLKGWPVTTIVNGNIVFNAQKSRISGTNSVGNGKINKIRANEVLYYE